MNVVNAVKYATSLSTLTKDELAAQAIRWYVVAEHRSENLEVLGNEVAELHDKLKEYEAA